MGVFNNVGGMKVVGGNMKGMSPRKAMASANVKGGPAKIRKFANGGVCKVTGGSRVVGGGMKNGGKVSKK
ncbi:MAG TPA: hypothetical protein VN838_28660 [Bradyrhizobium sp.]|nr:hypothetical protein [Bradyrhizobium sp.]